MDTRAIQRLSITSALSLILTMGAANAAAYSWTEILIPSIGPLTAFGINDLGQVTVTNAEFSKTGVYRNGIFTPLPASPPGYSKVTALGINNSGVIVGERPFHPLLSDGTDRASNGLSRAPSGFQLSSPSHLWSSG